MSTAIDSAYCKTGSPESFGKPSDSIIVELRALCEGADESMAFRSGHGS